MNSARPCRRHTVPFTLRPAAFHAAARSVRPSAVTTAITWGSSGIGFSGVATSSMTWSLPFDVGA